MARLLGEWSSTGRIFWLGQEWCSPNAVSSTPFFLGAYQQDFRQSYNEANGAYTEKY